MKPNAHISALALDALALGALDRDTAAHIRDHLASCAACRDDEATAAELRDQFAARVLPRGLPVPQTHPWRWLAVPAFAALVLLVLVLQRPPEPIPAFAVKGAASWQVYANRDGQTFSVHDGIELAAGDRLRFVVWPDGARYLLVASVDGRGAATIYHPYGGDRSAPIEGEQVEIAGSIVLDHAPGPEAIYAILSDHPIASEVVTAQLRARSAIGASAIRGASELQVPARAQLLLVFEKVDR